MLVFPPVIMLKGFCDFNSSPPGQNYHYFADDIFKCTARGVDIAVRLFSDCEIKICLDQMHFHEKNVFGWKLSLKFVLKSPLDTK